MWLNLFHKQLLNYENWNAVNNYHDEPIDKSINYSLS